MRRQLDIRVPASRNRDQIAVQFHLFAAARANDGAGYMLFADGVRNDAAGNQPRFGGARNSADQLGRLRARIDQRNDFNAGAIEFRDRRRRVVIVGEDHGFLPR